MQTPNLRRTFRLGWLLRFQAERRHAGRLPLAHGRWCGFIEAHAQAVDDMPLSSRHAFTQVIAHAEASGREKRAS